ncbi:MAG: hypothetical protein C3F15_15660 [Holophagae bacterium]|nr:MAG: hypothetical protein C3F15_15660 [Holophagae bacterium]
MSAARLRRAIWAGREPLARVLLVIVALAAIAAPAHAREQPYPELRRVVSFGDSDWTVVWKASTAEDSGQFRLYSGPGLDCLKLVDIQQATPGLAGYRYRDGRSGVPGWYYQLRYLNSKGEELVLGSLRVDPVGLQSTPASIHQVAQVSTALPAATDFGFALSSLQQALPADMVVADAARPEPDVPPPRCSQHEA